MTPRIPKSGLMSLRVRTRIRNGMSEAHLAMVRALPCVICFHARPDVTVDPHHLMRLQPQDPGQRGLGLKSADRWTVPLCRYHHSIVTDEPDDEQWFARQGIDARSVALALWAEEGNFAAQQRIIFRAVFRAQLRKRQADERLSP